MPQLAGLPRYVQNLDTYRVIGENIKMLRSEVPITQLEFARYIGIGNESLSRIEAGKNRSEYALVKAIAEVFGTTSDVLATRDSYRYLRESQEVLERVRLLFNVFV
ncbi:helix-turn-helix domain-containing protein [Nostoc sp. CHAB 5836]|uniref:helix-turn-helix transcriptional regulator n=1 Tax=Nostoc sp. CHAB 5836 TaxID=2780404 RepID=UPI001E4CF279|nr:helix-turn-helix transcriptional regulator [Nostoc sp. CHAB 5836]MCC5618176.1 helix-turn-helix domain-containing protein [Nostoc sp. CHAB 5836]